MYYDIIIIGGGASGLCLASQVKTENIKVLVIDHSDRVGKKLLSTGNGKCNLTNMYACTSEFQSNPENIYPYFTSGNNDFIETVINAFDCHDSIKMFNNLGILTENKNSYIYPRSEQASAVLDMFRNKAEELGVDVITNLQPLKFSERSGYFYVDNYKCEKLVLACGGMSAPGTGSDGTGYEIAKYFGHKIIKPRPVLCGLHCSDKFFKSIQGVRNDCRVNLVNNKS
ncbi:MAG: NAD(P)/FAD-dependent oxidoreductase, partial [Parasporobacterium sp.]|nr:NAD(P)/FAD-dependent oxidoreductase [Parasporobacterium sp.]